MTLTFRRLHPHFVAEVGPVDLRRVHDAELLAGIRAGMDEHAVYVFRDQPFTDDEQLAFAQRLDGELHTRTGGRVLGKSRLGNEDSKHRQELRRVTALDIAEGIPHAEDLARV